MAYFQTDQNLPEESLIPSSAVLRHGESMRTNKNLHTDHRIVPASAVLRHGEPIRLEGSQYLESTAPFVVEVAGNIVASLAKGRVHQVWLTIEGDTTPVSLVESEARVLVLRRC